MSKKATSASKAKTAAHILMLSEHPVICAGIRAWLTHCRDFKLVATVRSARDASARITRSKTDLLLIDLSPPTGLCFTTLSDLRNLFPELPILIISTEHESLYAERSLNFGSNGYVMEQADCEIVLEAIRHVLGGGVYLSPNLSEMIVKKLASGKLHPGSRPEEVLSRREFDVFQLIGHGNATDEIALRLSLSSRTVAVHRYHIRNKLKLRNSAELVQCAVRFCETKPPLQRRRDLNLPRSSPGPA